METLIKVVGVISLCLIAGCTAFVFLAVLVSDETVSTYQESETTAAGVTLSQFNSLYEGMTYEQVVDILGRPGEVISSSELLGVKTVMYKWDGTGFASNMNAMFQDGLMISKAQFGLK